MGRELRTGALAICVLLAIAPAAQAAKDPEKQSAKFKVLSLSGTQTSSETSTDEAFDPETGDPVPGGCTRSSSETATFSITGKAVAYVSSRRSHGELRSVWSDGPGRPGAFDSLGLDATASLSSSAAFTGVCEDEEDCSAQASVPWTVQLGGSRLDDGGAWVGARSGSGGGLGGCAYRGVRALQPYDVDVDFDDPAPHLFSGKELFGKKKKFTSTESFTAESAGGSSTVELTATLKRLKSKRK